MISVLISAGAEWRALRELLPAPPVGRSPLGEWIFSPLPGIEEPLLFFHEGWGKIAAAAATQYVIDRWRPTLLVNIGTCGGFAGEVERGEIILVERTVVYDIIEQMGSAEAAVEHYSTEIDLSWVREPTPIPVRRAPMLSADRDLLTHEVAGLRALHGGVAGDWESGAIAWVARRNHVPLVILRGVSDLVGSDGGEAYDGAGHLFRDGARTVMATLLESLPEWIRMQRSSLS